MSRTTGETARRPPSPAQLSPDAAAENGLSGNERAIQIGGERLGQPAPEKAPARFVKGRRCEEMGRVCYTGAGGKMTR